MPSPACGKGELIAEIKAGNTTAVEKFCRKGHEVFVDSKVNTSLQHILADKKGR